MVEARVGFDKALGKGGAVAGANEGEGESDRVDVDRTGEVLHRREVSDWSCTRSGVGNEEDEDDGAVEEVVEPELTRRLSPCSSPDERS